MLQSSRRNHRESERYGTNFCDSCPSGCEGDWVLKCACIGISSRFFENQHNEISSNLSEKTPKGRLKKKELGEGKEEKRKKQWLHS